MKKYYINVQTEVGKMTLVTHADDEAKAKENIRSNYTIEKILNVKTEPPNSREQLYSVSPIVGMASFYNPYNTTKRYAYIE